MTKEECKQICQDIYGANEEYNDKIDRLLSSVSVFSPKVICVITSMPYYRAMRRYLRQLYSLSLSSIPVPLEFYISSIVSKIPLPVAGGRPFYVIQDLSLISSTSKPMAPIKFDLPSSRSFPHVDLDFAAPLRCLSVEKLLVVFTLMLREAKLVFTCSSHTLLTETMETLKALLFPLTWSSPFISRLPYNLAGYLGALGGYMIGLQMQEEENCDLLPILTTDDDSPMHANSTFKRRSRGQWSTHLIRGTYIVDLTRNTILEFDGDNEVPMPPSKMAAILKTLPPGPKRRLETALNKISTEYKIGPQITSLEQFDSAFDFFPYVEGDITEAQWERFPTSELRDAFMVYMIDILGNYAKYMISPISLGVSDGASEFRTFKESFYVEEYLHVSHEYNMKHLTELLLETQMFSVLIQQRNEACNPCLVFYERAAALLRLLGLQAGGHGALIKPSTFSAVTGNYTSKLVLELPVPLYKLLLAYETYIQLDCTTREKLIYAASTSTSSTSGSLSPNGSWSMRSSTVPDSTKLYNTLVYIAINVLGDTKHNQSDVATAVPNNDAEALQIVDINSFRDSSLGVIFMSGPIKHQLDNEFSSLDVDTSGRYLYTKQWPMLNQDLINTHASNFTHSWVKTICESRHKVLDVNIEKDALLRLAEDRYYKNKHGIVMIDESVEHVNNDVYILYDLICELANISMSMLSIRSLLKADNSSVLDMLQIMGIISQLEDRNIVDLVDENVIRCVMSVCKQFIGNKNAFTHIFRDIAVSIYDSVIADKRDNNILAVDPLLYGFFHQIIATFNPKHNHKDLELSCIDSFTYLEEIGATWLLLKCTKFKHSTWGSSSVLCNSPNSPAPTNRMTEVNDRDSSMDSGTSSTWSSMFTSRSKTNTNIPETASKTYRSKLSGASKIVLENLALSKASGMMSFLCHKNSAVKYTNQLHVSAFSPASSIGDAMERVKHRITALFKNSESTNALYDNVGSLCSMLTGVTTKERTMSDDSFSNHSLSAISMSSASPISPGYKSGSNGGNTGSISNLVKKGLSQVNPASLHLPNMHIPDLHITSTMKTMTRSSVNTVGKSSDAPVETTPVRDDEYDVRRASSTIIVDNATDNEGGFFEDDGEGEDDDDDNENIQENDDNSTLDSVNQSYLDGEETRPTTVLDAIAIQGIIQTNLDSLLQETAGVIAMISNSMCQSCSLALLDEETMYYLYTNESYKVRSSDSNPRNPNSSCGITCPRCTSEIVPHLLVKCYKKSSSNEAVIDWHKSIEYYSPYVLRRKLELIIESVGTSAITSNILAERYPDVYWSWQWYSCRINVPTGLFATNSSIPATCNGPIIIGWNEALVEKQVKIALGTLVETIEPNVVFQLQDILPYASPIQIEEVYQGLDKLEFTFRDLIIAVTSYERSKHERMTNKSTYVAVPHESIIGRDVYVTTLTITHFYDQLKGHARDNLSAKGKQFERLYLESIRSGEFTLQDIQAMQLSPEHLLQNIPNKFVPILRLGLGFLF